MKHLKKYDCNDKKHKRQIEPADLSVAWSWNCLQVNRLGSLDFVSEITDDKLRKFAKYIHALVDHEGTWEEQYAVFLLRQLTELSRTLERMGH